MTDSDARIAEIEAREKAATPEPWATLGEENEVHAVEFVERGGDPLHVCENVQKAADATFIAHARDDVPWLLAEVKRQAAKLGEIRALVDYQALNAELWQFVPPPRAEYVQDELRKLHEAIEGITRDECARKALEGE